MSWLKSALDWIDGVFRGAPFRKSHKHYFTEAATYYFLGDRITVYIPTADAKELSPCLADFSQILASLGVASVLTSNPALRDTADVVLFVDKTLGKGGHTNHTHDPQNHRVLLRAVIRIADSEKGSDRRKTGCHESTHLFTDGHSDDDKDANHTPCFVTRYSEADKETLRMTYRSRPK